MKKLVTVLLAGLLALSVGTTGFAGEWKKDSVGWWYQNSDGTYQKNGWFQDTDGKYYYFNPAGYMLANTVTPDGYYVDASGAWVQNAAAVQTPAITTGQKYYLTGMTGTLSGEPMSFEADSNQYIVFSPFGNGYILDIYNTNYGLEYAHETRGILPRITETHFGPLEQERGYENIDWFVDDVYIIDNNTVKVIVSGDGDGYWRYEYTFRK